MTNGTVWHQRDNTSSLFNNVKVPVPKRADSKHWSKCQQSQSRRKTEVNFYSTLVIVVTLAHCGSRHPQGHNPKKIQETNITLQTNSFGHFLLSPWNTSSSCTPLFSGPDLFVSGKCLSLCLYLRVPVCLTLVWLGQVLPSSHQSPGEPVKAISPSCSVNLCQLCACVSS